MRHYPNHIAVWLDHSQGKLIYPKGKGEYAIESVDSQHDLHPREDGQGTDISTFGKNRTSNNEYHKHNREQNELHDYYRVLQNVLQKYDEILLFGPTTAKDELFNVLLKDKAFNGKRLAVESAGKLSEGQMLAFVKDYFEEETVKR